MNRWRAVNGTHVTGRHFRFAAACLAAVLVLSANPGAPDALAQPAAPRVSLQPSGWHDVGGSQPQPRWGHNSVFDVVRNRVIIFGGQGYGTEYNDVWAFSLASETWQQIPTINPPSPRYTAGAIADPTRDRIVVYGGYSGGPSNQVFALSLLTNTWSLLPTGPPPRYDVGATTDGNKAWFFGGFDVNSQGNFDLWQLDLASDTWSLLPAGATHPQATTNFGFGHFAGSLVLTGGHDAVGLTPGTWRYDLTATAWQKLDPFGSPAAGAHYAYGVDQTCGQLIVAGGDNDDENDVAGADALAMSGVPRFTHLPSANTPPKRRHSSLAVDPATRKMIMFGGWQGQSIFLADTWIYEPGDCLPTYGCDVRPQSPASTGYLAEGTTASGVSEWVLVANPDPLATAEVCITYMTENGVVPGQYVTVPPRSRRSVHANDVVRTFQIAAIVEGIGTPVHAERAVYSTNAATLGAHVGGEITGAANTWFMAEGVSAGGSETWVMVANPSATETAQVSVDYFTGAGTVTGPNFSLAPLHRTSARVNDTVATYDVSTRVRSTGAPVVAERASYIRHSGLTGATASPAAASASRQWVFGEGATAGGFSTWILVANPNPSDVAHVSLTYLTSGGPVAGPDIDVPPGSRKSVPVGASVTTYDVATLVNSDIDVVSERALFSNHPDLGRGAGTSEGAAGATNRWLTVEGATAGGFETWVLIANPDLASSASAAVTFLTAGGAVAGPTVTLAPGQRTSIKVDDYVNTYDVSTEINVTSGPGVVVERSVFPPLGPGRDLTSAPGIRLA